MIRVSVPRYYITKRINDHRENNDERYTVYDRGMNGEKVDAPASIAADLPSREVAEILIEGLEKRALEHAAREGATPPGQR